MKFVINNLEEVAEALRGEYTPKDGKFVLKTEGDFAPLLEANTKLAEFRDNNRTLNQTVTALNAKVKEFEGIDPVEHKKLADKVAELEASGVKDKGSVADIVKAAVKAAVTPLETRLVERENSEKSAREALARTGLENKLREAGVKAGVDDRALPDYINRGLKVFKLDDSGEPVARKGDQPIFSKKSPAEELGMEEWAAGLQAEAPFLFKPSRGGGASNNGNGGPVAKRTISHDPVEFGRNLEAIAKGEVTIADE